MRNRRHGRRLPPPQNEVVMTTPDTIESKLTRIYSERRQQDVVLRVAYWVEQSGGCKIYRLQQIEELE